ncbi:Plasmid replication protein RepB [Sinorhizobium alkalisoli]|nr:Plasmid replication protein RepB [Sinorhizobium alkalisoli]
MELNTPVKAIVRNLSDQEFVVAQGQENNERRDPSYIEKVRVAQKLAERFTRDAIMSALPVCKSDLSNMLAVAAKIPTELVDAIGPARGVGWRNWRACRGTDGWEGAGTKGAQRTHQARSRNAPLEGTLRGINEI